MFSKQFIVLISFFFVLVVVAQVKYQAEVKPLNGK